MRLGHFDCVLRLSSSLEIYTGIAKIEFPLSSLSGIVFEIPNEEVYQMSMDNFDFQSFLSLLGEIHTGFASIEVQEDISKTASENACQMECFES